MPLPISDIEVFNQLPGVSCVEYDEPMLSFQVHSEDYTLTIPERYPNANAEYYGPDGTWGHLCGGTLEVMGLELLEKLSVPRPHDNEVCAVRSACSDEDAEVPHEEDDFNEGDEVLAAGDVVAPPELDADVQALRSRDDVTDVTVRRYTGSTRICWSMNVTGLVSPTLASAWGIDTSAPIEATVAMGSQDMGATQPTVALRQRGKTFPFGQQMSRILQTHIHNHWRRNVLPNDTLTSDTLTSAQRAVRNQLCEMGFECDVSCRAAVNTSNIDAAIEYMTEFCPTQPTEFGLLSHLADVFTKRTPSISNYCLLCDKPHVFGADMLRPAVCSSDMCVFQSHELRLGLDSAESVATQASAAEFLLTIFRHAAMSPRASAILVPFPSIVDPGDEQRLILDPANPNINNVRRILMSFPPTEMIARYFRDNDLSHLKLLLDRTGPLGYPLVQWVIASNRSHLIHMAPSVHIPAMDTPHQFLLLTAAPEREAMFKARKEAHGTMFAFHGSRSENWHSILRGGLKIMSGTPNELHGARHGPGVYFACDASASFQYSSAAAAVSKSVPGFLGDAMHCIVLCEIILDDSCKDHGGCFTVTNEANIMTRFLFAYPSAPSNMALTAHTRAPVLLAQVHKKMTSCGL